MAIRSWACKHTQAIFGGASPDIVPRNLIKRANIKLLLLDAAVEIRDLTVPPANRLEKLSGKR